MEELSEYVLPNGCVLYLTNLGTAERTDIIKEKQIEGIITIGDNRSQQARKHAEYAKVWVIHLIDEEASDIQAHFADTRHFINAIFAQGGAVLVHCWAGISRSPTIVMAYLIQEFGMTYRQAFAYVMKKRKIICPNPSFVKQLKKLARSSS